jgi:hypothetical protein
MKVLAAFARPSQRSLVSVSVRSIYIKDKELDKSKYKPSETDQLENYLKHYMEDDPKKMSEEDRQRYLAEAQRVRALLQQEDKHPLASETTKTLKVESASSE